MRPLGRKLGIAGDGLGFALGANPHEIGEIALVKSQLLLIEMDNAIGHAFQQEAIMADQQHRAGEFDQPIFQPQRGFKVEVVGRLVQQQQIGLEKQRLGEGHAHAPAAGIFANRAHLRRHVEAQAGQHRGRAGWRGIGADGLQPVMNFARTVGRGGLGLQQQGAALEISRQHGIEQIGGPRWCLLRHIAHAGALG